MKYILYGNGGSGNHGCEAIVRGTKALFGGQLRIHSSSCLEDEKYGLENIGEVIPACQKRKKDIRFINAYIKMKLFKQYVELDGIEFLKTISETPTEIPVAFSVGGDNYCYEGTQIYGYLNKEYHRQGIKTVLWGCSVEPEVVKQKETTEDMKRYDLIVARESITYNAMKEIGANVILAPDPAFFMEEKACDVDQKILDGNLIGINISPHILHCAQDSNIAYQNYLKLIQYILEETNYKIALIPHVVWESNDDRKVLRQLYEDAGKNDRIILVEDHIAPELKYIISKCKLFIGARTHATIAAYSTCVPTIVVGYSVKARGIARDLFGTEEKYVLPVQELSDEKTLVETFQWFDENQEKIHQHLKSIMSEYKSKGLEAKSKVLSLF